MKQRRATLRSRWFGQQLRTLRESNDMKLSDVGEYLQRDPSQVSRFEKGTYPVPAQELPGLLDFLEVRDARRREALIKFGAEAWRTDWWDGYADEVAGELIDYVWLESQATHIRSFDVTTIYGLVQTPDYARALISEANADADAKLIERWVEIRFMRQTALTRAEPVMLSMIIDEGALRRTVGGPKIQAAALRNLADQAGRTNIDIRVLPFGSGAHASPDGSFRLMDNPEPFPDLACVEGPAGTIYLEPPKTDRFAAMYDRIQAAALDAKKSVALIKRIAEELE